MFLLLMALCITIGFMAGMVIREAIDTYKVMVGNIRRYKLLKLLNADGTGIVFGLNQHGKLWVEFKQAKRTVKTVCIIKQIAA